MPSCQSAWLGLVEGSQGKLPSPVMISSLTIEVPENHQMGKHRRDRSSQGPSSDQTSVGYPTLLPQGAIVLIQGGRKSLWVPCLFSRV